MPQTMLDKIAERIRVRRGLSLPHDTRQSPNQSPVQPAQLPSITNFAVGARSFIPRAYQVQGIEFLRQQKRAILGDAPGLGKAQPVDSPVLTPYGWVPIGRLAVGDSVCSTDGAPSVVEGVFPQGVCKTYRVSFTDGTNTECSDEHLWQVTDWARRKYTLTHKVLKTSEIASTVLDSAGKLRYTIPLVSDVHFPFNHNALPIDAYVLGTLLGDGTLTVPGVVYLTTADEELAQTVRNRLPRGTYLQQTHNPITYRITSGQGSQFNPVLTALRDLGLMGKRAETKSVPEVYKFSPKGVRMALLKGLLDTDGYVSGGSHIGISTASKQLADDIRFLVQSLGGTVKTNLKHPKFIYKGIKKDGQLAYRLTIVMPEGVVPFALSRKAASFVGRAKYPAIKRIASVDYVGERECVCIRVSAPNHLYITNDFIVTHNTFQATEAAELPCVISCPLPLVDQWKEFLEDQYPLAAISVAAYGNIVQRDAALEQFKAHGGWLIMNHDLFRRAYIPDAATLIVDEMHHFKSKDPARSKMLLAYSKRVERIYGLTATPVYKDVGDLWFQLHILDPKRWSSYWDFLQRFAVTTSYGYGVKVVKTRNKTLLDRELEPYVIQRTYASVGMQLPERIDKHVILRMDAGEKKRYDTLRDFYRLQLGDEGEFKRLFNAGAVLHELRKMTVTPKKLDEVAELVEEAQIATSRPVTVFVWYQDTAARVVEHLGKRGIEAVEITGELEPAKRRTLAQGSAVTVATMASLSEGVDLSYGRTVVFCETDYTPGRNYQALSRVIRHRTEQEAGPSETGATNTDPVVCYWVRYAGTVDQNIFETQKARTNGSALQVLKEALVM